MRAEAPVEVDEHGVERHPSFGMISAHRVSGTTHLFDSEIEHHQWMVLSIHPADRRRDLNLDWIHADINTIVEVSMSEAQWAAFVSSTNTTGVPCTITSLPGQPLVPSAPHEPRLRQSADYAVQAAVRVFERVTEAMKEVEEHPTKANLRKLRLLVESMEPNVRYAADTMAEHVENVVQKARADIEAMVVQRAAGLGLNPADVTPLLLSEGEGTE